MSFAGARYGWVVGDNGTIFGTVDRGLAWTDDGAGTTQALKGVWRRRAETAWAVGNQGVAPLTSGTPSSFGWSLVNTGAANQLQDVIFASDLTGYAVGSNGAGLVLRSDDGGQTWQRQVSRAGSTLNGVFFVDTQRGWAVGDNGTIVHTAVGGR